MMGDSITDEKKALSVFKLGQEELRQSIHQQQQKQRTIDLAASFRSTDIQAVDFRLSMDTEAAGPMKQSFLGQNEQREAAQEINFQNSMSRCLEKVYVPKIE